MGFSDHQIKCLSAKLSEKHVHTRTHNGVVLSYIEGWHAIAEANRIFGFDGWSRETLDVECVWEGKQESKSACGYRAHVRVTIRTEDNEIIREGIGFGSAESISPTESHELAIKASETDAMKRALSTFGNPFGLALYDKEQTGVRRTKAKKEESWDILDKTGKTISSRNTPIQFCSEVRKALESINEYPGLMAFWKQNQDTVVKLRQRHPSLKTDKGMHYGEVLSDLYTKRLSGFADEQQGKKAAHSPTMETVTTGSMSETFKKDACMIAQAENTVLNVDCMSYQTIDVEADKEENIFDERAHSNQGKSIEPKSKSETAPNEKDAGTTLNNDVNMHTQLCKGPIRHRNKEHLKYVATQACLVCGRTPSQAHHLKHAQLRALGKKPGDQWTVPLCAIHHRQLHDHGNEEKWWNEKNINSIEIAAKLWQQNHIYS